MHKKIVISGYYGFGNFGDELILSILAEHLKKDGHEICVFSSDPLKTSMSNFVNSVRSFDLLKVIEKIKQSDILISGGGSLLQDATSIKSTLYYLWVIFTALLHRKKVIIFAQGIGPIKNILARFLIKQILKKCTYISVRDKKSQEQLSEWGITSDLLCDPVFALPVFDLSNGTGVGVQLRDFHSINEKFLDKLALQITNEFPDKSIKLFVLQEKTDFELCKKFEDKLKNINPKINTEIIDRNITEEIAKLDYLIAMRFHALVIALKYGIKCLGINYDIKIEKLAQEAKFPIIKPNTRGNFDKKFSELKNLKPNHLKNYAEEQKFSWENFDKILRD